MKKMFLIIVLSFITAIILSGAASACLTASTTTEKSFTDVNGNPITTAQYGDIVYGMVNVVNNQPIGTAGLTETGVSNPSLSYTGSYSTSHDNQGTWNENDGSFDPVNNVWEYGEMNCGDSYWLKISFQVTGTGPVDLTITDAGISDLTANAVTLKTETTAPASQTLNAGSTQESTASPPTTTVKTETKKPTYTITNVINTFKSSTQKMLAKLLKMYGIII